MADRYKSAIFRLLKGAVAAALAAFFNYLLAHLGDFAKSLVSSPDRQTAVISLITGGLLALEKFLGWKDKP